MSSAPRPHSVAETRQIKRLTLAAAKALRQQGTPALDPRDMDWIEQHPHSLHPLLDTTVAACTDAKRDDALVAACLWLLANQLELIRYRDERGYAWATDLLSNYQLRLAKLLEADALPGEDWFELVRVMQIAKVPIQPEMAEMMAEAMTEAADDETGENGFSPDEMPAQLRGMLDVLAGSGADPFQVVQSLSETGALMPAEIRAYLTHELALSPHEVLREAVPLLLLDPEPAVRNAASAGLEQVAGQAAFSPVMLRRTLLIRNWVPEADRPAIDRLIRKVRVKGVACAQWEPAPPLEIRASMLDGSGAQGLMLTSPGTRAGLFAGLLLKQGFGVRDAWCDVAASRRDINRSLKDTQQQMSWRVIDRNFLDTTVQHHIACGLTAGHLPQPVIVQIAEAIGAADWKDRRLDVTAEAQALFDGLDADRRSTEAIATSLQRSGDLLAHDPRMESWFDDDPEIRAVAARRPRPKPAEMVRRVLEQVMPSRRETWAEKCLLMALWLRTAASERQRDRTLAGAWQDFAVLAHELVVGRPLAELPAMVAITERSLFAARIGGM